MEKGGKDHWRLDNGAKIHKVIIRYSILLSNMISRVSDIFCI